MTPSIGRIVHYQSYGSPGGEYKPEPRAAMITECIRVPQSTEQSGIDEQDYSVSLHIMNPTGLFFTKAVPYSSEPKPGHWNWPPKV